MESRQRCAVQRIRIIGMREAGHSIADIVRELGLTRQTIKRWLTRWEESGNVDNLQRPGRPRKTSEKDNARILANIEHNPFNNSVSVREQLHLEVSARTVRRRLHEGGVHHRVPANEGSLQPRHMKLSHSAAKLENPVPGPSSDVQLQPKLGCHSGPVSRDNGLISTTGSQADATGDECPQLQSVPPTTVQV